MHLGIKIDLAKLCGVRTQMQGRDGGMVEGIFLPIPHNNIFVSLDADGKDKGYYLDLVAFENKQPSQYGDTHAIKLSIKDYKNISEEQKTAIPFCGNIKPLQKMPEAVTTTATPISNAPSNDDLPF